jgi:hypothetical protein
LNKYSDSLLRIDWSIYKYLRQNIVAKYQVYLLIYFVLHISSYIYLSFISRLKYPKSNNSKPTEPKQNNITVSDFRNFWFFKILEFCSLKWHRITPLFVHYVSFGRKENKFCLWRIQLLCRLFWQHKTVGIFLITPLVCLFDLYNVLTL